MEEEEQFLEDLQSKGSPNFHNFLTAEEWNQRFAPSAQDEERVLEWARSQGMTVTNRFANRLLVDVEAPAGTIEKAFGVTINQYRVGDETDFANDRDPVIPYGMENILASVQGLNNIQRMHSSMLGKTEAKGPDYAAGPAQAAGESIQADGDITQRPEPEFTVHPELTNNRFDPTDIYSSQGYNYAALHKVGHCCNPNHHASGSPAATSIGIAAFGVFDKNDIVAFHTQYPYLAENVSVIYVDGKTACCNDEATLDTEWSLATSNSFGSYLDTAHVYLYVGANQQFSTYTDMYNQMLNDDHARVFSTSWSCTEVYGCPHLGDGFAACRLQSDGWPGLDAGSCLRRSRRFRRLQFQ